MFTGQLGIMKEFSKWAVLPCAFLCNYLGGSVGYTAGIIHIGLLEKYGRSEVMTSWAGALLTSTFCLAGPVSGMIITSTSCRTAILIGGTMNLIGLATSGIMPTLEPVLLTYGVITGIGQSLTYSGSVMSVGYYFRDKPNLATGIVVAGTGIGIMTFPPLAQMLLHRYDVSGTLALLGAITFQSNVFGCFIRIHPLELEKRLTQNKSLANVISRAFLDHCVILRHAAFIYLCFSILSWSMAINISVMFLPEYFVSMGSSKAAAAFFISVFGCGNMLSRILMGVTSSDDLIDGKVLYFGSYGLLSLLTFSLPLYGQYETGKVLYCLCLGLYSGGTWTLLSPIALEIVGIHHLAMAFGFELFTVGIGFLVGPLLGGLLHQHYHNFDLMFIFSGGLYLLTSVLAVLMALTTKRQMDSSEFHTNKAEKETLDTTQPDVM